MPFQGGGGDTSGLVPYTGATADVNLGLFDLLCVDLTATGVTDLGHTIGIGDTTDDTTITFTGKTVGGVTPTGVQSYNTQDSGYGKMGMFTFKDTGTSFLYGGGYDPVFLINRIQTVDYAGCVALQAWAIGQGADASFGEMYGFWGGYADRGNTGPDVGQVAGIMCYNALFATNVRTVSNIIGGYFTSEINGNVTGDAAFGGFFSGMDGRSDPNIATFLGVEAVGCNASPSSTTLIGGRFTAVSPLNTPTSITNAYGVYIRNPGAPTFAPTNDYGLYIESITKGTNKYAIYTGTGSSRFGGQILATAGIDISAKDIATDTTTGTKIGTATNQKIGFFNATPVVQATVLTTALTDVTCTAPGTPDYAWTGVSSALTASWGFASQDEFRTMASILVNLRLRVGELESKFITYGLLASSKL